MIKYLPIFVYLTFLGGTVYSDMNFGLRVAHHVLVSGLLAIWLVGLLRRRENWPRTGLEGPIALFMGVRFAGSLFGADPRMSAEFFWRPFTHLLLFYWLVWLLRSNRKDQVLRAYFLVFGVVCLMGIIEYAGWYFGLSFLPIFQQGWPEIGGLRNPIPPSSWRLSFTLSNATSLSTYLSLLIPPAVAMAIRTHKRDMRVGWILLIGAALLVQLLTRSRAGLLGLLAAAAFAAAAHGIWHRERVLGRLARLPRNKAVVAASILSALVVVALAVIVLPGYIDRPTSLLVRLDMWQCAFRAMIDHPLLGVGAGGFGREWRICAQTSLFKADWHTTAHNLYLNLAAESGILGILTLALVVGKVISLATSRWQSDLEHSDRITLIAITASLAGYAVNSLFDTLLSTPLVLPVILLVAWLVAPLDQPVSAQRRRLAPALALGAVLLYLGGLLWIDVGQWYFQDAVATVRRRDYAQALELLDRAQEFDPALALYDFQEAFYLGQLAYRDPGRYLESAIAAQEAALQLEDSSSIHLANLTALRWQNGDLDEAMEMMARAVERVPVEPTLWLNYGLMAEQLGRHERALDAYAQALAEEPQWAGSGFWTESAFRRQSLEQIILRAVAQDTGEADLWFAAGDYERALEATIAPLTADEYAARGRAHLALGAFEDAQRDLARALALCPSCAEVYVDRAVLDWELGQVENAGRDARTALFVNPGRGTRAHLVLAWIALDRGDVDAAIVHLERAVPPRTGDYNWSAVLYNRRGDLGLLPQLLQIEGGADWFAPWLQLADLYVSLGHPADAADLYRLILARDPFVPGVAERLTALR